MIIGWPPSSAIAVSKEILVRGDGLSNSTATVRGPAKGRSWNGVRFKRVGEIQDRELLGRAEIIIGQEMSHSASSARFVEKSWEHT